MEARMGATGQPPARKLDRRVAIAIACAAVVVVGLLAVHTYTALFACSNGCGDTTPPLREGLSLGSAQAGHNSLDSVWYENLSIVSASSSLTVCDVSFNVLTQSGGMVSGEGGLNVTWTGASGGWPKATWSPFACFGGNAPANVYSGLSLAWSQKTTSDPLTGDDLVVYSVGPYQGNITATLA